MILFVDFDGVLHPVECIDTADPGLFSQRWCLDEVVRSLHPSPRLVISSAWRRTRRLDELKRFFPSDIEPFIVGKTPEFREVMTSVPDHLFSFPREAECWSWLRINEALAEPWLAIDDQPGQFRPFSPNLYAVDPSTGLTESDVPKLMEVIRAKR
ncbi:MAG: hypothetical protein E6Q78_09990 [Rhodoferax sp.]|nr:MAG: hypothetical protein E6Q78_09990 [Rhodoferax sp.]